MSDIDALVSILKNRNISRVCYFHTDHFEPWSNGINADSIRAVEHFHELTKKNIYTKKLSLFYMISLPYILKKSDSESGWFNKNDKVGFAIRSDESIHLAGSVIQPLEQILGNEIHLHIHHERWTKNSEMYDPIVHRWVNENSSLEQDSLRLDLGVGVARAYMEAELGRPFNHWAFVHGNWALNGSDSTICQIEDEINILSKHGCWGDFTFPAGRGHCDPITLQEPYTCSPIKELRAYDTENANILPVSDKKNSNSFFIWNSKIKANHSSLDYYYEPNCKLFKQPKTMVEAWLEGSFEKDGVLYVKTHSHSMKTEYRMHESGSVTPHCHPDVMGVFDLLERVLERAKIPLELLTVNDVRARLAPNLITDSANVKPTFSAIIKTEDHKKILNELNTRIKKIFIQWLSDDPEHNKKIANDYYLVRFSGEKVISEYEQKIIEYICKNFPVKDVVIHEVGIGLGTLTASLAYFGYEVIGYESEAGRATAAEYIRDELKLINPLINYKVIKEYFPDALNINTSHSKKQILVTTNIINTFSAENQERLIKAATIFDGFIFDVSRFGVNRADGDSAEFMDIISAIFSIKDEIYNNAGELIYFLTKNLYSDNLKRDNVGLPTLLKSQPMTGEIIDTVIALSAEFYNSIAVSEPRDSLYESKNTNQQFLTSYELVLLKYIVDNYTSNGNVFYEIGAGMGCFSIALSALGFEVRSYEGDTKRFNMSKHFLEYLSNKLDLEKIYFFNKFFPNGLKISDLSLEKNNILISTNIVNSFTSANQDYIIKTLAFFNEAIIDLGRFGINRNSEAEVIELLSALDKYGISAGILIFDNGTNRLCTLKTGNMI
jgi:16S rRNA A1518/A1519 N6-dimethyltransferase RsmA/KsgA/DIM1 with predicted DNA glycosylase/AP lyase activity